jgi:nucleoside-diphosphate-sugar epimerase
MNAMPPKTRICALTGANGFVGNRLRQHLQRAGWRVVSWTRQPEPGTEAVPFRLGQEIDPGQLRGVDALVHCAYDFGPVRWDEIAAVNVVGSEKLFAAARAAGVRKVVCISSISAYGGCRSLYGQAKMKIEGLAQSVGAIVIRPGLVHGEQAGGMFGRLERQVRQSRLLPVLAGGKQRQYLVHEEDLGDLICGCLVGRVPGGAGPVTAAHERGWELREILEQIAGALGKRVTFVPVPWQLVWLGLKTLEVAGRPAGFRSDSLISMVYQNPRPDFELLKSLGFQCRPLQLTEAMLGRAAS